jgi:hypothetical protein
MQLKVQAGHDDYEEGQGKARSEAVALKFSPHWTDGLGRQADTSMVRGGCAAA